MRVRPEAAEAALLSVWEHAGTGCGERRADGLVEMELWLPPERAAGGGWLREALAGDGVQAEVAVEPERPGWMAGQRRFHRPFTVRDRLRVRPPWHAREGDLPDVIIDPGMAFGTGQHATTRGCLELLCEQAPEGRLLDVGCGSGILAIAARRLGFADVRAVDIDPDSVAATLHNARANGVALSVARRDFERDALPHAEVLVANLTATLLARLARTLAAMPPERAVVSGLRPVEVDDAAAAFAPLGLGLRRVVEIDGWAAVLLGSA